ncbi:hypothetical protein JB92DRAFT_2977022 [Gautieria morchelliformis]|nr:hypothetical protein JB92DRAFT_2977022 [Gautieria morchelliformis]
MSALFHFQSLLLVILLLICTSTYVRSIAPRVVDRNKEGCVAFVSVSAYRLSPYVALSCIAMAVTILVQ